MIHFRQVFYAFNYVGEKGVGYIRYQQPNNRRAASAGRHP